MLFASSCCKWQSFRVKPTLPPFSLPPKGKKRGLLKKGKGGDVKEWRVESRKGERYARGGEKVRDFPQKKENKKVLKVNKHFKHAVFNNLLVMFLDLYIDVFFGENSTFLRCHHKAVRLTPPPPLVTLFLRARNLQKKNSNRNSFLHLFCPSNSRRGRSHFPPPPPHFAVESFPEISRTVSSFCFN